MNPWMPWLSAMSKLPFGGDVTQAIAPYTNWFSPTIELDFAGDRRVEADVVSNVASYGKQLGILTEAVLALAADSKAPEVGRLREIADRIEACKQVHRQGLEETARSALDALKERDPQALARVLDTYAA
jgi:hypothetical protein